MKTQDFPIPSAHTYRASLCLTGTTNENAEFGVPLCFQGGGGYLHIQQEDYSFPLKKY